MPVYFIATKTSNAVKIGWAEDVEKRLRSLQCANHEELKLIRVIEGGITIEHWFHKRFEAKRIRGEWFRFDCQMLAANPPERHPMAETHPLFIYRQEHDISQADLATLAAPHTDTQMLTQCAIANYENGRRVPQVDVAMALERATGFSVNAWDIIKASRELSQQPPNVAETAA